eukprot:scaffold4782_cov76-Cyclotella_meneghiniana.AAC.6
METTNQQPHLQPGGGHIMQSRTSSTSHNLRSNSRGRRSRRYTQIDSETQKEHDRRSSDNNHVMNGSWQDFNSSAVSMNNNTSYTSVNEQLMDENGRCRRHPGIELCRRENYVWRILLQDCPLCSMEVGHNNHNNTTASSTAVKNNGMRKGGESSLKTDTTSPLSEEEECKSWTMSDASCSEEGDSRERDNSQQGPSNSASKADNNSQQQPPPPPRRKKNRSSRRRDESKRSSSSSGGNNKQRVKNNQVANLKELAQKLAAENIIAEQQQQQQQQQFNHNRAASSGDADNLSMGGASNTNSKRGHNPPPPPPRRITAGGAGDLRNMSTKELSELRRNRKKASQGEVIDEASDLISRMSKMSKSGPNSNNNNPTAMNSTKSRKQSAAMGGVGREESQAILGAAAEARARVMSRRSKLINDGDVEIPYNDRVRSEGSIDVARGRMRGGDDILGAAEEIRLRARRSVSRSRERVKSASLFCGETPTEDYESEGETVATSTSKRSILNPHGLSVPPQAPSVERRSTSRGKERGYTPETNDDDSRPRSRNRRGTVDTDQDGNNNLSSAQALIIRRREMRERIAERQSNAEKRNNMNRFINDTDLSEKSAVDDLANAMLHEWSDVTKLKEQRSSRGRDRPEGRERRGRSRSAVRDGISKIRSASLSAFRNKPASMRSRSRGSFRDNRRPKSETQSTDDFEATPINQFGNDDDAFSRSSLLRRLSKTNTSSSQGVVKSLGRNNSIGDRMNDYGTIKSDGFVAKNRPAWYNDERY